MKKPVMANEDYFKKAEEYFKNKDYQNTLKCYGKALDLDPECIVTKIKFDDLIGTLFKVYISVFTKKIHLNPNIAINYVNRGVAYENAYNLKEAIDDYNKAIKLDSKNGPAYFNKGTFHLKHNKDYNVAIRDLTKAIKLGYKTEDVYAQRAMAYLSRKKDNRDYKAAICDYNKAIRLGLKRGYIYNNLVKCYVNLRKIDEALCICKKHIKIAPLDADAYWNLAEIYYLEFKKYQTVYEHYIIFEELIEDRYKFSKYSYGLLEFFTLHSAPLLTYRIIKQFDALDTYLSHQGLIERNREEISDIIDILAHLERKSKTEAEENEFQLFKGVITYYMKDPSVCYKIFDEVVDENMPNKLMGQYYFVLSCDDYLLSEPKSIQRFALKRANKYIDTAQEQYDKLQTYYAGQIFFISKDYHKAIECFSKDRDFIPSQCMQIVAYNELCKTENKKSLLKKRDKLIQDLILLDKQNKGLLQYAYIPNISITDFKESIMKYSHIREIEGVIPVLNDYTTERNKENQYKDIRIPKNIEFFKIDVDTTEGMQALDAIKLSKKEVIDEFCEKCEQIFNDVFSAHFNAWQENKNKDNLANSIGANIPQLCTTSDMKQSTINLIDYF